MLFSLTLLLLASGFRPSQGRPLEAAPRLSLLALGDTGKVPHAPVILAPQRRVARAMALEDRRHPVDALVLLGDNFYPEGLREKKLKLRLRQNLVQPYCHFLSFTPRGAGSLEDDCDEDAANRNPVPLYAVLGNHDYGRRHSPDLQRVVIPEYLPGWHMPVLAEAYELGEGVSLVAYQSEEMGDGGFSSLVKALRSAKGPWRILAAHHPMVDPGQGFVPSFGKDVLAAIRKAGVSVHLYLAGHEHNQQVLRGPGAALHVVVGSGAALREVSSTRADRPYAASQLGFARVDLLGNGEDETLRVTLHALGRWAYGSATPVSRWEIQVDGTVRELPASG